MQRIKIPKACEPCRRRKTKCNGETPCLGCQSRPSDCRYRHKPRVRNRNPQSRAGPSRLGHHAGPSAPGSSASPGPEPQPDEAEDLEARPELYGTVAASPCHAPQPDEGSQLFYGSSSNFAFLQHLHRIILPPQPIRSAAATPERGDPGLDMFMQRDVFFGVPSRMTREMHSLVARNPRLDEIVPRPLAELFLDNFKIGSLHIMPFVEASSLDHLFFLAYHDDGAGSPAASQRSIMLPLVLAIGACNTPHTDLAEALFTHAKSRAAAYEDAVTLPMIQVSLLMADYQINIGRPNSGYLYVGTACRKALAMGLNAQTDGSYSHSQTDVEDRRTTMWTLYFFETSVPPVPP